MKRRKRFIHRQLVLNEIIIIYHFSSYNHSDSNQISKSILGILLLVGLHIFGGGLGEEAEGRVGLEDVQIRCPLRNGTAFGLGAVQHHECREDGSQAEDEFGGQRISNGRGQGKGE